MISAEEDLYPLVEGSVTIVNRDGDGIAGTYTGTSRFPRVGVQRASLTLQIASGSGRFEGATGSLAMEGAGSFTGDGRFLLEGHGEVALPGGKRAALVLSLEGSSVQGCAPSTRIAIFQRAEGTMGRAGRVTATLSHEIGNTGCIS
jgi:hypothetical protein